MWRELGSPDRELHTTVKSKVALQSQPLDTKRPENELNVSLQDLTLRCPTMLRPYKVQRSRHSTGRIICGPEAISEPSRDTHIRHHSQTPLVRLTLTLIAYAIA